MTQTEYVFETSYGIVVKQLNITNGGPRHAGVVFATSKSVQTLQFVNPQPISCVIDVLDYECRQLRIVDLNAQGACLEFGRYEIQVWDEDAPYGKFAADFFQHFNG